MADTTTTRAETPPAPARADRQVPPLEFPPPACPVCEVDLELDDTTWTCERCHLEWPDAHLGHGVFYNTTVAACGKRDDVILYPYARKYGQDDGDKTETAVCVLDEGHAYGKDATPHAGFDPDQAAPDRNPRWVRWGPHSRDRVWP